MTNIDDKKEITEQIKFMINAAPEELFRIISNSIELYIKSAIAFGIDSNITKENLNIIKDMTKIILKERKLLKKLESNISNENIDDIWEILDILEELNERTYNSYDDILKEIEIACDIKDKKRIIKQGKPIDSLITNEEYTKLIENITLKGLEKKRN